MGPCIVIYFYNKTNKSWTPDDGKKDGPEHKLG